MCIRKYGSRLMYIAIAFLWAMGLLAPIHQLRAQQYDLLIKGGHLIDPKNTIDEVMDVAIKGDTIATVAKDIDPEQAQKVIDADGLYVTPGLIDPHTHVFVGGTPETFANGSYSVSPDDFTLRSGVTTVVDAGTAGWRNFPVFKKQVIAPSKTRVLSFLNIFGLGMIGYPQEQNKQALNAQMAAAMAEKYPDIIVGIKIGHYRGDQWGPFETAANTAQKADMPLLVECHLPGLSLEGQLQRMRPGDILTHVFEDIDEREPVVDTQGKVRPFVLEARKRGILFDVGHGGAGFWFSQAIPAVRQGFLPNTFGTDLHRFSMNAGMINMLNVMSKFLNIGMSLERVIRGGSWSAAQAIGRPDLGNLSEGSVADVAVLNLRQGPFGFVDAAGNKITGDQKLQAELTLRAGEIVWDLNGMAAAPYKIK